jgi:hypothetical protein
MVGTWTVRKRNASQRRAAGAACRGALSELRLPSWRVMHEYKFLQTICENGRPTDCVPFINRFPPVALQCPESRFLHPLEIVPLFSQIENDLLFFRVA